MLFPVCFNVGIIVGPTLGGALASPALSYPRIFQGLDYWERYPYLLPNLVSALILLVASLVVFLGLQEVSLLFPTLFLLLVD